MDQRRPSVSVIMPARGAADFIQDSLRAIHAQTYENVIDVVVSSADPETTAAVGGGVTVVANPAGSTPTGLNLAIDASHGEVVVRCDAQAILPPDYVDIAVKTLIDTGADVVGGMQVPEGRDEWGKAIAGAMASPFGSGDARYRIGGEPGPAETVYLGVFRRDALERVGGFDPSFLRNQDYELNHRIIESGGVVWFEPRLRVSYTPRRTLRALASQYFSYGRGKRHFARKHPGNLRTRQWAPPTLVVGLAFCLLAGIWDSRLLAVPSAYVIALAVAGAQTNASWWRVALALGTMHLSWGLGFLVGAR